MTALVEMIESDGGKIRRIEIKGEFWFVGKDVCEYFGDSHYRRSLNRLDDDEKGVTHIPTSGGVQKMTIINEPGLYALLHNFQPKKARFLTPEQQKRIALVEEFKDWIVEDVLPSIRETGSYSMPGKAIDEVKYWLPDFDEAQQQAIAATIEINRAKKRQERRSKNNEQEINIDPADVVISKEAGEIKG